MIISYQWLLQYLPEPISIDELSTILTSIGLEVEAVEASEAVKGSLEGLVIGQVLTCEKHPNADKLKITTVDTGNGKPLNVVCGAPNVEAGQRVVVATVGTTVHPTEGEPFMIKKAKIRGEESEGMICAEDEIGLGKSHAGIMILPETAQIGTPAKVYFNIPEADYAIHIGLTPNRSDAMSHIGVAKDVCAYLSHHNGKKYQVRQPEVNMPQQQNTLDIKVNIDNADACPRYMGISMTGVQIGPSPEWLQQRLKTIGVRSINNVVDITNFVLHEYGQPLHAFDADKIKGHTVNVRTLAENSPFITLDEKERKLTANDLMICDAEEGMCIAGVFGGVHSGITDSTNNIFLESAYFSPLYIRRTSMHHGLRTDAATHFEKGVDINNLLPALKRAAALIAELCGGKIASGIIDVVAKEPEAVYVETTYEYINKLSGKTYPADAVKNILTALGFEIVEETSEKLKLKVPTNKTDVKQPADIVEEVLRIDGLDNIEIPQRLNISLSRPMVNDRGEREKIANLLTGMGFQEIVTNSIVNSAYYPERNDLVKMLNSLSSELDVLRPSMLESGLEVIQYNSNRKNEDLLLYEFGKVYSMQNGKYAEEPQLAIYIAGNAADANWKHKAEPADIFYLKSIVQKLQQHSGIAKTTASYENNIVSWKWKNELLCTVASVDNTKLDRFGIKQDVCYAEINWNVWLKAMQATKVKYQEVPKYPAVQRDLSIVLDKNVSYEQVQQITEQQKIETLKSFDLFDVFESEKLGAGKKSFALSYTFQLNDRTLTDSEIDQMMQQLISTYKNKLQAQIRE
jgi:phenylalanyl-tRNA synthetase beta chain